MRIEETILSNLLYSEDYCRKVLPYLKKEYFNINHESAILDTIAEFVSKYNDIPSKEAIKIGLSDRTDLSESEHTQSIEMVDSFENKNSQKSWLIDETEKFCRKRSIYNAISDSIQIIDGRHKNLKEDMIPKLLQDALAVSFSTTVGHSYLDDSDSRYESYLKVESGIPYDLNIFNKVWKGLLPKTLTVIAAQSGGGKSLVMSHIAASSLMQGYNVLYISLEMSENKIGERIDANLLKTDIQKIIDLGKETFTSRIESIKSKTQGKLFIKEYPPSMASVSDFRTLLEELKIKKGFVPNLIIVDYVGIMASSRMKMGGSVNTYSYLKSIAEELRALGVEFDVPIVSGAQLNRGGFNNSDVSETDLADSMGLYMTADVMYAVIRNEELDQMDQLLIKQLKNRYGDPNFHKRFVIGVNRPRMTLYDLEQSAQRSIMTHENQQMSQESITRNSTRKNTGIDNLNF